MRELASRRVEQFADEAIGWLIAEPVYLAPVDLGLKNHWEKYAFQIAEEESALFSAYRNRRRHFPEAPSEIQDPAKKLKRLVGQIDGETWLGLPVDVKGEFYEGLLARKSEHVKSGAAQYSPRPVIEDMVKVIDPQPHQTIHHRRISARSLGAYEKKPQGARHGRLLSLSRTNSQASTSCPMSCVSPR